MPALSSTFSEINASRINQVHKSLSYRAASGHDPEHMRASQALFSDMVTKADGDAEYASRLSGWLTWQGSTVQLRELSQPFGDYWGWPLDFKNKVHAIDTAQLSLWKGDAPSWKDSPNSAMIMQAIYDTHASISYKNLYKKAEDSQNSCPSTLSSLAYDVAKHATNPEAAYAEILEVLHGEFPDFVPDVAVTDSELASEDNPTAESSISEEEEAETSPGF